MPMKRELYASNWEGISRHIRFDRAHGRCEKCGAPDGKLILRSTVDPERYLILEDDGVYYTVGGDVVRMSEMPDEFALAERDVKVVLTVHHIDFDPSNNDESNLLALCARCHLIADQKNHMKHAKQTRQRKHGEALESAGQGRLL